MTHVPTACDLLEPIAEHLPSDEVEAFARFYLERAIATVDWACQDDWTILVSLSTRTIRWQTPKKVDGRWGRRMAKAPIPRWTQPFELRDGQWVPTQDTRPDRRCVHFHIPRTIPDRDFHAAMNIVNPVGESVWSAGTRTLFGPCRRGPDWGAASRTWVMDDLEPGQDRVAQPPLRRPAA